MRARVYFHYSIQLAEIWRWLWESCSVVPSRILSEVQYTENFKNKQEIWMQQVTVPVLSVEIFLQDKGK